ncbi:hypothetical protein VOLCADRAFT_89288 [Volvox carteri f. nagariensis]|uniref:Uncharacterized protein n=1 Tax=Volvox carteri f. nagariensis TaxID=3068 RepID=D8TRB2_VOLCA|nr:uncharacterized protein VOLCADRAFT_89288 [Volvox carteri f. nagariensis]EFJ49965.1 hypothetical protein VOLCADRAFT_89288 [Volvox carteri f. nagariensis]|eukprot:XP_002949030.1 hypothetical protein VOLCADRAFT_89288 [Volvox carteri f. nagariensis]
MNLFSGFQDHLASPNDDLLGQTPEGQQALIFAVLYPPVLNLPRWEGDELRILLDEAGDADRVAPLSLQAPPPPPPPPKPPQLQSRMSAPVPGEWPPHHPAATLGGSHLMMSAYAFLNSDSMREFYDKLMPVSALYDEMHELPVVQKRKRCMEMSYLRMQLMQDPSFTQILQAVCLLRHHLYSLSRKVLVMNQGPDGIPIDLLLGSMSTELFHLLKGVLPQEICDLFGNCLPHPRLAVLVFAEFTSVDPMPTLA